LKNKELLILTQHTLTYIRLYAHLDGMRRAIIYCVTLH